MHRSAAGTVLAGSVVVLLCACDADPSGHRQGSEFPRRSWTAADPIPCKQTDSGAVNDLVSTLGATDPSVPEEGLAAYGGRIETDPVRLGNLAELRSSPW